MHQLIQFFCVHYTFCIIHIYLNILTAYQFFRKQQHTPTVYMHYICHLSIHISSYLIFYASLIVRFIIGLIYINLGFLGENVVVQRNSPSLVFSTWSFIESQIRVYRKIENNTHICDASLRYCSTKTS